MVDGGLKRAVTVTLRWQSLKRGSGQQQQQELIVPSWGVLFKYNKMKTQVMFGFSTLKLKLFFFVQIPRADINDKKISSRITFKKLWTENVWYFSLKQSQHSWFLQWCALSKLRVNPVLGVSVCRCSRTKSSSRLKTPGLSVRSLFITTELYAVYYFRQCVPVFCKPLRCLQIPIL